MSDNMRDLGNAGLPRHDEKEAAGWPICKTCGFNVLEPEYAAERIEELERDLRNESMERSDAERDNTRLRAELQRRDAEWGELAAEKDHWQRRYLEAERHRTELLILIGLMRDERENAE